MPGLGLAPSPMKFQRALYQAMLPVVHLDDNAATFLRRFQKLFPEEAGLVDLVLRSNCFALLFWLRQFARRFVALFI